MTCKKIDAKTGEKYTAYQRHIIRKLRDEMAYTRRPDIVQSEMDFARLSIICAKRGYMLFS